MLPTVSVFFITIHIQVSQWQESDPTSNLTRAFAAAGCQSQPVAAPAMAAMNVDVQRMTDSMRSPLNFSGPAPILATSQTAANLAPLAVSAAQVTAPAALQTQAVFFPLPAEVPAEMQQLENNKVFCAGVAELQSKPQVFRS